MTKINKIVLSGFKSFGKRTELLFDGSFNIILGPNGSGKSNIMDALCFVLGRASSKSLRAERAANLIYNGGKTKKPASKGEVSIFFDNSNKVFPSDEEFIKISRIVKQTGQSVYKINDKRHTRQQILDLLSVAKIDPEGYNIILQGDIDKFVEMSSIERRQVIEEIAGISVYEDKKQKAIRELEKVGEKLREADILLTERKTHLDELKVDRDQALKYKELSDKVKQNKATELSIKIKYKERHLTNIEKSEEEQSKLIKKLREDVENLKQESENKDKLLKEISEEIEEKGEKEQVRLHKDIEGLKIKLVTRQNRLDTCTSELNKLSQRRQQLKRDSLDIDKKVEELETKKSDIEKQQKSCVSEKNELEKSIERLRKRDKLDSIFALESDVDKIESSLEEKQTKLQDLVTKKQDLLREKDKLELRIASIDEIIEKVSSIEKESKEQLSKLKKKKNDFEKIVSEINQLLNKDADFAKSIKQARQNLEKAQSELMKFRAKELSLKEHFFANKAVRAILGKKEEIKGIYGTISELGSVKGKYSLALEVAAGPRLSSIVVDNDEVAAKCIEYLKSKKLGVATFLPLNKIKPRIVGKELEQISEKHKLDLAVNLVSFDKKFEKAFSYVFGNTLVVENMDVARKVGIGKARMVTLGGDLAELSGAMHGGYRIKRKRGFREDKALKELEEAEKRVNDLSGRIKSLNKEREENEGLLESLKKERSRLEGEIIKTEHSLHLEAQDLDASKQQKKELGMQLKKLEESIKEIETGVEEWTKELTEIKSKKQKLREKISELSDPKLLAELNAFEQKRQELTEQLMQLNTETRNIDLQISNVLLQEKQRIKQILKQIDKDEQSFKEEREALKKELETQEGLIETAEQKATKFYSHYRSLFGKRDRINDELQKIQVDAATKEEQIRNIDYKLNNLSLKRAETNSEFAGLKKEFEHYTDVELLEKTSIEQIRTDIASFDDAIAKMGGVNLKALEVYDKVEEQYNRLLLKKEKLVKEKEDVITMMKEVELKKKDLFMNTFNVITDNFMEAFNSLSPKGKARLVLENPQNPFEAGVRISVKITGNKFMDIRSLSGGEKALTALAFIFSIQEYEPAHFYILDEVDAALDKRNSEKLADLIAKYSEKAQYVMISHNDVLISEGANLYGVSMDEHGMSNVVSLKI